MNLQDWLNSGIIEAYVLGDLNDQESREVEAMANQHAEVRDEIRSVAETFTHLAKRTALAPPSGLRDKVFAAAEVAENQAGVMSEADDRKTESQRQRHYPISRRHSSKPWKFGFAASVILLVFAAMMAFMYRSMWQDTEQRLSDFIAENQEEEQRYQVLRSNYESLKELQSVYADPAYTRVVLNGTESFSETYATVYWNAGSNEVYLAPAGLPEPESGKQYQLWAIVDGKPRSAGMVNDLKGLNIMEGVSEASAFAITLEPQGGSESPTMEAMYVMGEV